MKNVNQYLLFFLTAGLLGCSSEDNNLKTLSSWMTGSFSSEEQSVADTNYFNIHLYMVPIWKNRKDGKWLYVEQAASWALDQPYRQRVYRLTEFEDDQFESAVFTIPEPMRFAGDWKLENPLKKLTPDSLAQKVGCSIILKKEGNAFIGSTVDKNCSSQLRGASYATSEVRIEKEKLTSWDRGFDQNGSQVWGAESGPYIFIKSVNNKSN